MKAHWVVNLGSSVFGCLLAVAGVVACSGNSERNENGDGSGGRTKNVVVKSIDQGGVDKIDLLFMIDNSISMADKQSLLAESVPVLVQRLVDPICVDADGNPIGGTAVTDCGTGRPEFAPIRDLHVGIITSSLGNHGGDVCVPDPAETTRTLNDRAELLPNVRAGLYSFQSQGFLVWDPRMGADRPTPDPHAGVSQHETDANSFVADFRAQIAAAGERGCSYEASLEAWYRFLIDPEPISTVTSDGTFSVRGPVNNVVLDQRRAFLRPDSLLAIVMLTDENDCSIVDENGQQGWLVGRRIQMPRASSECADPGSTAFANCCRPCVVESEGCPPSATDPSCAQGPLLTMQEDSTALRCFHQTQRFGLDLLYPWARYSEGLKSPLVTSRMGGMVPNSLYTPGVDGTPARTSALVYLVGILGVPWQDLADDASRQPGSRGLRYLTTAELQSGGQWDLILGDPDLGREPTDPFMLEQVEERIGVNPTTADLILPSSTTGAGNAINGHEADIVNRDDLQYACTFNLPTSVPCSAANQDGCDCNASEEAYHRPICQYPTAGADGIQVGGKAYPSVRQLEVLKGFGDNAIVTSVCPKNVQAMGANDPNYGYTPAVSAMIERFKEPLGPSCLPRPLEVNADGSVSCRVVEAMVTSDRSCNCATAGRKPLEDETIAAAVREELTAAGLCGTRTGVACEGYCLCEIAQLRDSDLDTCQLALNAPPNVYGFCYVDQANGAPELIAECPETQRQIIRFMGQDIPRKGAHAFIACGGS